MFKEKKIQGPKSTQSFQNIDPNRYLLLDVESVPNLQLHSKIFIQIDMFLYSDTNLHRLSKILSQIDVFLIAVKKCSDSNLHSFFQSIEPYCSVSISSEI